MKSLFLLLLSFTLVNHVAVGKEQETENLILGTWKYTNQGIVNSIYPFVNNLSTDYDMEYFIFEADSKFRHEFINKEGIAIKILKGKWKTTGESLNIDYSNIDYNLDVPYFFLDNYLIMGENFSHVIFTRYIEPVTLLYVL